MRNGSKEGFLVFYNKTFQLSVLFAAKLMNDPIRRDDFLSEFYPYALLHINDLKDDTQVFRWMERLLPVFYELWSGEALYEANRPIHPELPDDEHIRMSARTVWEKIQSTVIFPSEKKKQRIPLWLIIIGFLSLITLVSCLLLLQSKNRGKADQATIDAINQKNMDFSEDLALDSEPKIEGLYTETTTETIIEGGTERGSTAE